jgi:hypothetical protein
MTYDPLVRVGRLFIDDQLQSVYNGPCLRALVEYDGRRPRD